MKINTLFSTIYFQIYTIEPKTKSFTYTNTYTLFYSRDAPQSVQKDGPDKGKKNPGAAPPVMSLRTFDGELFIFNDGKMVLKEFVSNSALACLTVILVCHHN